MHQRTYEAREVLRILGVKPHVLRYWEQSLPLIRPGRNESGYRVWNGSQLRMLLRIRHLVVERGMSVAAAGYEILHEAEPGTADTKARLEALRSRLITLLLYNRAGFQRKTDSVLEAPQGAGSAAFSFPLNSDALTVTPLVPSRRERQESPAPAQLLGRPAAGRAGQHAEPMEAGEQPGGVVLHVPVSHLFTVTAPVETARTLRAILRARNVLTPARPALVPVPAAALATYREVFAGDLDEPGGDADAGGFTVRCRLLPVLPVTHGATRWWSPRMSLFIALATDVALEQWLGSRGITSLYLWAPEDPSLPEVVSDDWRSAATAHRYGVAIGVQRRRSGVRLPDATVLHLPTWKPALTDTLAAGRWRMGRAHPEELAVEPGAAPDSGWSGGWRFDVWQRDLLSLLPPYVTIPPPSGPVPWYGASWTADISRIWPDVELPG